MSQAGQDQPGYATAARGAPVFAPIERAIEAIRSGRMVVLTDDEDRENEGDLVVAAEHATPEVINFMLTEARGYLCLSLTEADCERLDLHAQSSVNTSVRGTPFTVSIDGHPTHGLTTGVSARERAETIRLAIDGSTGPADFVRPGHINPLRARDGGVLVRIGQTEGSVDLCRLAGLSPSAVIIEIMRPDGEMARLPDLIPFCEKHGLLLCSVRQIIEHRLKSRSLIEPVGEPETVETAEGPFTMRVFRSLVDPLPHIALTFGDVGGGETDEPTLVRMHRRDLLGDVFGVRDGGDPLSTGETLRASLRAIREAGRGAVVYLRPRAMGRELGASKLRPPGDGEDRPEQSVSSTVVEFGTGSQILRALGLRRLRLLTNSDASYPQIDAFGLEIVERVAIGED
ncbi:MAG: 3,4-dihydroxy-2-butanone-4-phosphate synthase [Planctomycetota bacterium]